jgi:hypothetical protein
MSADGELDLRWALPQDEPDIRALIGAVAMPGTVSVRFAREPNYQLGTTIMGDPCDVLIARRGSDGQLAAMGCRSERQAYVNGIETTLGYIGQIRVAEGFRGTWLIQRGAQWFNERGAPTMPYFGVIASDNPRARALLTGGRLPAGVHVRRMCGMTTYAIALRRGRARSVRGLQLLSGSDADLAEIVEFLNHHGRRRQFFPAYRLGDFVGGERMRGLVPEDIMIARRNGAIAGVMAVWDQAEYKQDVVDAYAPSLQQLRPAYDLAARLLGFAPLTPPGSAIPLAFAACVCIANDDLEIMRVLLTASKARAYARGKAFLMLGLAKNDPLLAAARRTMHVTYHSDLYAACWSAEQLSALDERIPYVEIATL